MKLATNAQDLIQEIKYDNFKSAPEIALTSGWYININ